MIITKPVSFIPSFLLLILLASFLSVSAQVTLIDQEHLIFQSKIDSCGLELFKVGQYSEKARIFAKGQVIDFTNMDGDYFQGQIQSNENDLELSSGSIFIYSSDINGEVPKLVTEEFERYADSSEITVHWFHFSEGGDQGVFYQQVLPFTKEQYLAEGIKEEEIPAMRIEYATQFAELLASLFQCEKINEFKEYFESIQEENEKIEEGGKKKGKN